jgi:hypothetical protein
MGSEKDLLMSCVLKTSKRNGKIRLTTACTRTAGFASILQNLNIPSRWLSLPF